MCFGDLQLTGQSLSEFKQTIEVSFSLSVPQYRIMHYSKTTQPSALPLWKWFGLVCAAEDSSMPVVFIQHGDTMTCTSAQRKSNFVACHACETASVCLQFSNIRAALEDQAALGWLSCIKGFFSTRITVARLSMHSPTTEMDAGLT